MVVLILLLILAVLLFGSAAVLGGFGILLGFVAAVVALVYAKVTWGLSLDDVVRYGFLGFIGMIVAFVVVVRFLEYISEYSSMQRDERERASKKNTKPIKSPTASLPASKPMVSIAIGQNNFYSAVKVFFYTLTILLLISGFMISIFIMLYKSGYIPAWL